MATFDNVYTVKRELSKDQFLRALLVKLGSHYDTPYDVCNAKFGEITESVKEVILCSAHVESDYTASIGYDRTEEYWDKEKKTEYVNGNRREYYVDVKKTRTVTDWQPHSGHISGDATCLAYNEDGKRFAMDEHDRLVGVIKSTKEDSIVEKGTAEVSYDGLEAAKKNCAFFVEIGISYPGDHHKDERSNADVSVKEISCYKLPFYEVEFTYNGKKYHATGFACGDPNVETEFPPNNINIQAIVSEETKPYKVRMIIGWVAFGLSFILAASLSGNGIGATWTWAFVPITLVIAIVLLKVGNKKYNTRLHELKADNKKQKLDNLKQALSSRGYQALSTDELSLFN